MYQAVGAAEEVWVGDGEVRRGKHSPAFEPLGVSSDPFCGGHPHNAPDTESSRRACSVPPLRGSYGPAPLGAFSAAGRSTARPAMALRARLLAAYASWRRYAPGEARVRK